MSTDDDLDLIFAHLAAPLVPHSRLDKWRAELAERVWRQRSIIKRSGFPGTDWDQLLGSWRNLHWLNRACPTNSRGSTQRMRRYRARNILWNTHKKNWTPRLVELGWDALDAKRKHNGGGDPFSLLCLSGVDPMPVEWSWPGYLAIGKLTLLGGDPDLGKSLICTDAAARQSRGDHCRGVAPIRIGSTIVICSEDGIADTIRPRAEAAGAILDKLHVFESALIRDGKRRTFSLQDDLEILGAAVDRLGNTRLVCIDAITSYMGKIDSHRGAFAYGELGAFEEDYA